MTRRFASFLMAALLLAEAVPAQSSPESRLLVAAQGPAAGQSLLLGVGTASGAVTTLLDQTLGTVTDITMERDNVGCTLAYCGPAESGLHFLSVDGNQASLVHTEKLRIATDRFRCVDLTSEDVWVAGTTLQGGYSRLYTLEPGGDQFQEVGSFAGAEVARILVERKAATVILGLNSAGGGALVSYDCQPSSRNATTLADGLGTIADVVQDPGTEGFLVGTRDPWAPLVYIGTEATLATTKTFTLPSGRFPNGLAVDALAIDVQPGPTGKHALWVLAAGGLFRFTWDPRTKMLEPPETVPTYRLPSSVQPTAMILEGDRDYLLRSPKSTGGDPDEVAVLTLQLGPRYADQYYFIAASLGSSPGLAISPNRMINLRPDPLFFLSLSGQLPTIFEEFQGPTGPHGEVTGRLLGRGGLKTFASTNPIPIYFAGIVVDPAIPGQIRTVTNTVAVMLF